MRGRDTEQGLLQAVDCVHHALKLRLVDQIKGALFAGKHFERNAARSGNHSRGFLGGQIPSSNCVEREVHQNAQPANTPAFFVNLRLGRCRSTLLRAFHDWAVVETNN